MPRKKKKNDGAQDIGLEEGGMEEMSDSAPATAKQSAPKSSDGDDLSDELAEDLSEDDGLLMDEADDDKEDEY